MADVTYSGKSGSGEVAALVSFCVHVSKLYSRTKWPVWLKVIPNYSSALWSDFCQQNN
jgi:hypothetical protein